MTIPACPRRRRARGFTLIEIMVAVAIVGILAAIAVSSYSTQIGKSRRTDAKNALLDLVSREEKFSSLNNVYTSSPANLGLAGTAFPVNVQSGSAAYYTLSVTLSAGGTAYTATATPTGAQASDKCGSYTITQLGVQSNTGNTLATADCW